MPISRQSLREQVRDELLRRIGSGVLAPGDRIIEAAVAEELGVSSVPVREAIRELVAMGVLESGHYRGGWVREIFHAHYTSSNKNLLIGAWARLGLLSQQGQVPATAVAMAA